MRARRPTAPPPPPPPQAPKVSVFDKITAPATLGYLKGALFGPPGTGKTTAALSGAGRKLLVLTEPEGDLSVSGREDVDVIRPSTWKEMEEIVVGLHTTERTRWPRIVFDSVTFMFEIIGGKDILATYMANKDIRNSYGKAGAALNHLIHDAVALPMNVIFIAQMKTEAPGEDGVPLNPEEGEYPLGLAVSPMVHKILVPSVSFVGRTYKKMGIERPEGGLAKRVPEYWVSFEDFGRSPARSRVEVPAQVKSLNLDDLLASKTK